MMVMEKSLFVGDCGNVYHPYHLVCVKSQAFVMGFSGRWGSYLGIKFSSSLDGAQKTTKNLASFQNKYSLLSFSKWIRMCFLSIEEKTFLSLWPTEPSDSLPPPPQEIKINYNVVYMRIIMRDIISTEEQTTSSVKQEKWKRGIFYLSSKYKSDSSGNGKEGE